MAKSIGERYGLSETCSVTVYYDGSATLIKGKDVIVLTWEEARRLGLGPVKSGPP